MGNPLSPLCGEMLKIKRGVKDFYICEKCNKHWPRSAVIIKFTAREGTDPKPLRTKFELPFF